MSDNVIPITGQVDNEPDPELIRISEVLLEVGLLEFPGDGTETLRFTRNGLGALTYMITHLALTIEDRLEPYERDALDLVICLVDDVWSERR